MDPIQQMFANAFGMDEYGRRVQPTRPPLSERMCGTYATPQAVTLMFQGPGATPEPHHILFTRGDEVIH